MLASMLYNILYTFLFLILFPILKLKAIKNQQDFSLKERFVLYKDKTEKDCLWFHCASVGELNTVKPLYEYYRKRFNILITVSSPRGKQYALKTFKDAKVRELPFDFPFTIKRFINLYRPKGLIIVEEELWFNLITVSSKFMPVFLVNARVSEGSFNFYKKFKRFFSKIYNSFSLVLARSKEDANRISYFADKVKICGDLKLVSSQIKPQLNIEKPRDKKVIVAGSTYSIEEEWLLDAIKDMKDTILILAPRHLERLNEVKELIKERGLTYQLFSDLKDFDSSVVLVDTFGVLPSLYKLADVAFIGGTIEEIGGHNPLEALVENKPVIIGKHHHKIKPIVEEFNEYVFVVSDKEQLRDTVENLLSNTPKFNLDISKKAKDIFKCYTSNIDKFLDKID